MELNPGPLQPELLTAEPFLRPLSCLSMPMFNADGCSVLWAEHCLIPQIGKQKCPGNESWVGTYLWSPIPVLVHSCYRIRFSRLLG